MQQRKYAFIEESWWGVSPNSNGSLTLGVWHWVLMVDHIVGLATLKKNQEIIRWWEPAIVPW